MRLIHVFITLFLFVLFGLKDLLILFASDWPHLYALVNVDQSTFEEVYCYLPLSAQFSFSKLSFLGAGQAGWHVFPILTLAVTGFILNVLCFGNVDLYLLVMHTAFPIASFWVLVKFYRKYISFSWAALLAFFGVTFFNHYSSFGYLFHVLWHPQDLVSAASFLPMEISRAPIPSFTFFIFILCFYFSLDTYKISTRRLVALTLMWALNIYVYPYNFVAGILFWFAYFTFAHVLKARKNAWRGLVFKWGVALAVTACAVLPYLLMSEQMFARTSSSGLEPFGMIAPNAGLLVNDWGVLVSYILPVILALAVIRLYCGDYYELLYKFTPIFIMIGVEVIILNLHMILGSSVQPQLFSTRIGNFFSRYLYFLPIIYFFSNPIKRMYHSAFRGRVSTLIHQCSEKIIIRNRHWFAGSAMLLLSLVVLCSHIKYYQHFKTETAARMRKVEQAFKELYVKNLKGMMVSDDMAVNLYVPVHSLEDGLVMNIFTSRYSSEEIMHRLLVFAKIYNWSEEKVLRFMMPADILNNQNEYQVTDEMFQNGFGYWLAHHKEQMDDARLAVYRQEILRQYANLDLPADVAHYKIKRIQSRGDIHPSIGFKEMTRTDGSRIYHL